MKIRSWGSSAGSPVLQVYGLLWADGACTDGSGTGNLLCGDHRCAQVLVCLGA